MEDGRYCLMHDEWVHPLRSKAGNLAHIVFYETPELETEVDACEGPFTYSEPPEALSTKEWDTILSNPPDADELRSMDEEASNFFIEPSGVME